MLRVLDTIKMFFGSSSIDCVIVCQLDANRSITTGSKSTFRELFVMADERSRWDRMCPLIWADDWFVDYFWLALTMLRADWVKLTQKSRQEGFHVWLAARRPDGRIGSFSDVCDDIANQTSQ
jgi:hypothetical protein